MRTSRAWRVRLAVCAALLAAAVLRAPAHPYPPGLYRDEAHYGLDALATLRDGPRLWYPANNGREPLFIWAVALGEAALGSGPSTTPQGRLLAVRLPALAASLVLVAALFATTARLAGRRAGVMAAALAAALPWAVLLGRTGLRAGLLPPLLALSAAATLRGLAMADRGARDADRAGRRWIALGGALGGLALYSYTAGRALPLAALLALAPAAAAGGAARGVAGRVAALVRPAARWAAAAALVALPLAVAVARTPDALWGRLRQVAVVDVADAAQDGPAATAPAAALRASAGRTAGMVFVAGDRIARHNLPWRPVFGPLAAALWLAGLAVAAAGLRPTAPPRRRRAAATVVAATAAFALPTALAADAPHFLRAVGLLPALVATAAVGGAGVVGWSRRRLGRPGAAAAWAFVALAVALEARAVLRYDAALRAGRAADPRAARTVPVVPDGDAGAPDRPPPPDEAWTRAYHAFDGPATALAIDVAADVARGGDVGRVWLDRRLRDGWASVPYLAPIDAVTLTDPYDPILAADGVAYVVPYGLRLDEVWAALPSAAGLTFEAAVPERGDQAPRASPLYVRVTGPRSGDLPRPTTRAASVAFAGGPELRDAAVWTATPADPAAAAAGYVDLHVATRWRRLPAPADPAAPPPAGDATLYVHVVDAAGRRVDDGGDAPLGQGIYPLARWRPGDEVVERRTVRLAPRTGAVRVVVGLYAGDPSAPLGPAGADGSVEIGSVR